MCEDQNEEKHILCTQQTATGMQLFRSFGAFDYWNQRNCACADQGKLNFYIYIFPVTCTAPGQCIYKCKKFNTNIQVQELRAHL